MRAAREITVAATPDKLWALLWDVPRMVECMPGCAEAKLCEQVALRLWHPHRQLGEQDVVEVALYRYAECRCRRPRREARIVRPGKVEQIVIGTRHQQSPRERLFVDPFA